MRPPSAPVSRRRTISKSSGGMGGRDQGAKRLAGFEANPARMERADGGFEDIIHENGMGGEATQGEGHADRGRAQVSRTAGWRYDP